MPIFDRFDIVAAHYWWSADHHEGQWSPGYRRLCRIARYYHPGAYENGPPTDNARDLYRALCERHGCAHGRVTVKAWDYEAITYDGAVYCLECLPQGVDVNSEEVCPIFAGDEWPAPGATCDACGTTHEYMHLMDVD